MYQLFIFLFNAIRR